MIDTSSFLLTFISKTAYLTERMYSDPNKTKEFVSLLTDHQEVLKSYVIGQLPGCTEVRDIVQEVNILLWEKMDDFEMGTNFGTWACTCAYYMVCNYRKKVKRNGFLVFCDELSENLAARSEKRVPEALEAKSLALAHCLTKLKESDRVLLRARYDSPSGDMESLAAETGRSRGSLRVALNRLRAVLKNCITSRLAMEGGAA
ncbi:MAG: sigma-70 family RNA polymerase sigma factor [Akkermansiaceae bacterium]|jgi:RNA polymerase sigma-70 factor, ECF subfamily|nr:sigma-70 family RNA polymerase sigma factor [Akkermansiaceae bacterium]MDP4848314.1 sigma-70 family RNA polymerase sigma factor [Akkermansiaceae bacterium]MDP4899184.1 sigma-70 family RNA polymerase sigma factor [Akkermansiaceae bacterium]MDP4995737.1 sigma-70 family RNA polymerase sigma factor [Akkermansiaceae bacterium]